jgi:hypothetical protein
MALRRKVRGAHSTRRRAINWARCQCMPSCVRPSLPNSPFCAVHQNACPRVAPLTGYEPATDADKYNKDPNIRESHNCYAFAFGIYDKDAKAENSFHQPGFFAGAPTFRETRKKTCPDILWRLHGDMPSLKMSTFSGRCPAGTSKIALGVDARSDYHFWRQRRGDGYWDHKPGATEVVSVDALGRPIYDPELASRNYNKKGSHLNYNRFCGYMCAPRTKKARAARTK